MASSTYDLIDTALITGGAGGIGRALAESIIKAGKKVIIVGRTESKLQSAAKELGSGTKYYVLDTGDIKSIPSFVNTLLKENPEVNCLINNAGVQRPFQFPGVSDRDYEFDLAKADQEIDINIRGPLHLCVSLLPHFTSLPSGKSSVIINVSSVLGYSPFSVINPVYNGSKAWVHFFTENMRTQLKATKVKIVEIIPPTVATDLHRERTDPDDNKKDKNDAALGLDEFMEEIEKGLKNGQDKITAGMGKGLVEMWDGGLGKKYKEMTSS